MRFHVLGLPHTVTSKEYCGCAYTQKVLNFCKMMTSLDHEVIHYGARESEVDAAENVPITSRQIQEEYFGAPDFTKHFNVEFDPDKPYWKTFNAMAALAIQKRARPKDFVCVIGGRCHLDLLKLLPACVTLVEYGVGYTGVFSRFRVFESYTHQSAVYGMQSQNPDVQFYDAVIPNYYDPDDFPRRDELVASGARGEYLLFVGRMIQRKGLEIAVELARRTQLQLIIAGQGLARETPESYVTQDGIELPKSVVEYVGYANVETRRRLMQNAVALVAPTTYLEPFGGVAVEAQLCGTPAITTDFGGFVETVRHGETGYRCHTLAQFCEAVKSVDLLAVPEEIQAKALSNYSIYRVRGMYEQYFQMLETLWDDGWYSHKAGGLEWLVKE